jgi:cobalamin biosynthesis protein CobT
MMAARSQVIKVPGFRSGKLHGGSLHRLKTGDDRVFRRTAESISKETVVTLLIDNSGSMTGSAIQVAMATGYALCQTLERVGIKHEVIGFTTCGYQGDRHALEDYSEKLHEEQTRIGRKFSRTEPLFMPIYKGFDERLTPTAKARFAYVYGGRSFLLQNIDGECLGVAGDRIAKRREPRKVILVLSDGAPACSTSTGRELASDLRRRIKELAARKIETIGIGIEDDSVKAYYPKYVVLEDLNKLPGTVMGELRRILLSN